MPRIVERRVEFSTPWFEVIAKSLDDHSAPHYTVKTHDYVSVFATTTQGDVLLVRQYRPVIEDYTLELPSGLIDSSETPEACARRELMEETGYQARTLEFIGTLVPDVGRLGNRMWCFAAPGAVPLTPTPSPEPGIELLICSRVEFLNLLATHQCVHALNYATLMLAALKGHFQFSGGDV